MAMDIVEHKLMTKDMLSANLMHRSFCLFPSIESGGVHLSFARKSANLKKRTVSECFCCIWIHSKRHHTNIVKNPSQTQCWLWNFSSHLALKHQSHYSHSWHRMTRLRYASLLRVQHQITFFGVWMWKGDLQRPQKQRHAIILLGLLQNNGSTKAQTHTVGTCYLMLSTNAEHSIWKIETPATSCPSSFFVLLFIILRQIPNWFLLEHWPLPRAKFIISSLTRPPLPNRKQPLSPGAVSSHLPPYRLSPWSTEAVMEPLAFDFYVAYSVGLFAAISKLRHPIQLQTTRSMRGIGEEHNK